MPQQLLSSQSLLRIHLHAAADALHGTLDPAAVREALQAVEPQDLVHLRLCDLPHVRSCLFREFWIDRMLEHSLLLVVVQQQNRELWEQRGNELVSGDSLVVIRYGIGLSRRYILWVVWVVCVGGSNDPYQFLKW